MSGLGKSKPRAKGRILLEMLVLPGNGHYAVSDSPESLRHNDVLFCHLRLRSRRIQRVVAESPAATLGRPRSGQGVIPAIDSILLARPRPVPGSVWHAACETMLGERTQMTVSHSAQSMMPTEEAWRIYRERPDEAMFFDIETTGLVPEESDITVIGAIMNGEPATFVKGINLHEFPAYVAQRPLLVSFNGIEFDVPFLQSHLPEARLDQPHIDLRFVLRSLGYRGGLKAIEKELGLVRGAEIQDIDGMAAIRLWGRYMQGDRDALDRLIAYNLADVSNLKELLGIAMGLMKDCSRQTT